MYFNNFKAYLKAIGLKDVTTEYERNKNPGIGSIVYEPHTDTVDRETGDWYFNKYGGNIIILEERFRENEKNPDALIDGLYAEFKAPRVITGIDDRLRKANKQIYETQRRNNANRQKAIIIVNITKIQSDLNDVLYVLARCFVKRIDCQADLIIRKDANAIMILRK